MELLGLQAEGRGGGPRWGCSGRLGTISALKSQPWFNARLSLVLICSVFPKNLNHATRQSLRKYFKAVRYVLVPLYCNSSTITPVWGCEHVLAKSSVWSTHVTHPGSWAACTELHHPEKTELFEKPGSSAARSLSRSSPKLYFKAPIPASPAVIFVPIFFSPMEKVLVGHAGTGRAVRWLKEDSGAGVTQGEQTGVQHISVGAVQQLAQTGQAGRAAGFLLLEVLHLLCWLIFIFMLC